MEVTNVDVGLTGTDTMASVLPLERPLATVADDDEESSPELIVDQFGAFVGKHSERLRVSQKGVLLVERPLFDLTRVLILGRGITISSDAIRACAERGIAISFVSGRGDAYAQIVGPGLSATVDTRRQQLIAFGDARGATLARAFVLAKMRNQANLLKYLAKNRRAAEPELFDLTRDAAIEIEHDATLVSRLPGDSVDAIRAAIFVHEAHASRLYWEAMRALVRREYDWLGRRHEGAEDVINCLLNYGYGVLYGEIERSLIAAGLDAYAGFIHTDRPGKPSLVFDFIEEFRQPVVDRTVMGLVNRGTTLTCVDGRLDDPTRRLIAERVLARLAAPEPYEKKRHTLKRIIRQQALHMASYLRHDRDGYVGYIARW